MYLIINTETKEMVDSIDLQTFFNKHDIDNWKVVVSYHAIKQYNTLKAENAELKEMYHTKLLKTFSLEDKLKRRNMQIKDLRVKLVSNKNYANKAFDIGNSYGWAKGNIHIGNFSTIGYYLEQING